MFGLLSKADNDRLFERVEKNRDIAIAQRTPLIGGFALDVVGPSEVPHAAAIAVLLAALLFHAGYFLRRRPDDLAARTAG